MSDLDVGAKATKVEKIIWMTQGEILNVVRMGNQQPSP